MLTFSFIKESKQAASYYEQTDDYYAKEGQRGEWDGKGATALGLQGGVDRDMFKNMLEGRLPDGTQVRKKAPQTGKDGKKNNARLGIDFTFSAPKSVSIVALVANDRRVIEAHNEAVRDALKMMESKVIARQKIKGKSFREHTDNFVAAKFQHDLSRDQDPQLHTHAVVMNLTQRNDGRWTALANEEMLKGVKVVGAYYRAQLAQRLQDMGYDLRATRNGFEMASVSDDAIELFSKRSRSITDQLAAQGLTRDTATGGIKQTITKNTRKRKDEGDRAALRNEWRDALAHAGIHIPEAHPDHQRAPARPQTADTNTTSSPSPTSPATPGQDAVPSPVKPTSESGIAPTISVPPTTSSGAPPSSTAPSSASSSQGGGTEAKRPDIVVPPVGPNSGGGSGSGKRPDDNQNAQQAEQRPSNDADKPTHAPSPASPATGSENGSPVRSESINPEYAREVVNFAIEHLTERQGIFTKSELLERAYMKALRGVNEIDAEVETAKVDGRLVPELPLYQTAKSFSRDQAAIVVDKQFDKFRHDNDLHKLTRASWVSMLVNVEGYSQERAEKTVADAIATGRLVETEERYTTGEMRRSEHAVIGMENVGRETVVPIKTAEEVDALLTNTDLNQGQRDAAKLVLTTNNRYVGIQGYAGTGKSHMLSKSVEAIKAEAAKQAAGSGYQVIGLAPYGSQNKALKELGMESQTLASFLMKEPAPGALGPKTIIFLDEASVVPVHQMKALMERVEQSNSRLVLIGDRKQTQAVEAGKPFEQLQDAGMSLAHVTEIQRQRDAPMLKAAVEKAATGNVPSSVLMLKENTMQIETPAERYKAIANDYARLSPEDRNKTLIVVGTNEARREINRMVRENLDLPKGELVRALETYDMSRAEHRQASSYITGIVLVSERDAMHGLKRGEQFTVDAVDAPKNTITVVDKDGNRLSIDAAKLDGVSTYRKTEIELVPGDWVRLTRNDNKQQVYNGERHQVRAIEPDAVVLENGARLAREGHIHAQHGYAQTVHSAQGLTSDRVLIDADTKSLTSNRAVYYVAISRPRTDLRIYTDDQGKLAGTMSREPKKYAALELRDQVRESEVLRAASAMRQQEKNNRQARATLGRQVSKGPDKSRRQSTAKRGRAR